MNLEAVPSAGREAASLSRVWSVLSRGGAAGSSLRRVCSVLWWARSAPEKNNGLFLLSPLKLLKKIPALRTSSQISPCLRLLLETG